MTTDPTTTDLRGGVKDEPGSLRVLQLTDLHLFADTSGRLAGMETERSFAEVMERVLTDYWPVDLILVTGDIAHDGGEGGYRRFKTALEGLAVRTLVVPGNHDDPTVMRRVFGSGRVTWSRNALLGNWQFVMLDSVVPGATGGRLGEGELAALEHALAAQPSAHAMICLHHHPISMASRWIDRIGVENGDALLEVVDRHPQVRALTWGHVHQAYDRCRGHVRLLATPSTCFQFQPGSREFALDGQPPGFRWLQLHADGRIDTAVIRLPGLPAALNLEHRGYR